MVRGDSIWSEMGRLPKSRSMPYRCTTNRLAMCVVQRKLCCGAGACIWDWVAWELGFSCEDAWWGTLVKSLWVRGDWEVGWPLPSRPLGVVRCRIGREGHARDSPHKSGRMGSPCEACAQLLVWSELGSSQDSWGELSWEGCMKVASCPLLPMNWCCMTCCWDCLWSRIVEEDLGRSSPEMMVL